MYRRVHETVKYCNPVRFACVETDVQAKITGPEEVHVKRGSTISLTCIVDAQDIPPSNVTWYHAGVMIDFDGPRCVSLYLAFFFSTIFFAITVFLNRSTSFSIFRFRANN